MDPLIITVAPSGVRHPGLNLPETPAQLAQAVYDAYKAGASIAHIHGPMQMDSTGRPLSDPKGWVEIVDRIREKCDIVIQFGVAAMRLEQRIELLQLRPDMASFLLGLHDIALPGVDLYSIFTREDLVRLAEAHVEAGVKPEFEVWHAGCIWNLNFVTSKVPIGKPYYFTLFLGWPGGHWSPATVEELHNRISVLPADSLFGVSVVGPVQTSLATLSIILGGHVRVGFEDNPYYREGVVAESNAQLVARIARISEELGREVATPDQARRLLGIKSSSP